MRVHGIRIRVHWLLWVALPLFAYVMGASYFAAGGQLSWQAFAWGGLLAIALFASVTVHELAHSLVALRAGVRVREILLMPLGGASQMEAPDGDEAPHELAIAASGPLASLALAALAYGAAAFLLSPWPALATFARWTAVLNLSLGAFNLLVPAFPMDGGRVLRALLAPRVGLVRATHLAARVGRGATLVLGIVGLVTLPSGLWLILIALFVYAAGAAEESAVETAHVLKGLRVRDVMTREPVTLPAEGTAEAALRTVRATRHVSFPVIESNGGLVGVLELPDLARVPPDTRVRALVRELPVTASPDEPASGLLSRMTEARQEHVVVLDHGKLEGFVSRSDFARLVQIANALSHS